MPQNNDEGKMVMKTKNLKDKNLVLPFDKVKVEWLADSGFGHTKGDVEEVHPLLAAKLVKKKMVKEVKDSE